MVTAHHSPSQVAEGRGEFFVSLSIEIASTILKLLLILKYLFS